MIAENKQKKLKIKIFFTNTLEREIFTADDRSETSHSETRVKMVKKNVTASIFHRVNSFQNSTDPDSRILDQ